MATAPGPGEGPAPAGADPGGARRRRFRFTRRRRWQLLIAVEVVIALGVSLALTRDPDAFTLDGVDRERFCPAVQRYRLEGTYQASLTIESAPTLYDQEARAYRDLSGSAPTDVRPDFDKLAGLSEQLVAIARDLQGRQRQDPSFAAGIALTERQAAVSGDAVRSTQRVESSIRQACGVDLSGPLPTTTAAPGPSVPAVPPVVPVPGATGTPGGTGPTG